jgi:PPM family protein phosphatase
MSATSTPEAVAIQFASQCDRGKVREENQDSVRQCATPLGELLIVADGIGGYEGGGVASRMAVDVVASSLEGMPAFFPIDIAIEEAVCRANAEIFAAAAEPGTPNNRMGSTVVLALLQQNPENAAAVQAWIGHIGDSRAYLVHDRRLTRITRDHSAIQLLLEHDLIAPEQARNHPDASVLTRTLGHEANVKVDLNSVELGPGDTLLLCSDGLWGYVSDEEIERVFADPDLTVEQASRSLLDLALDAGGHDNVGIQMARLAGCGTAAAPREPAPAYASQPDLLELRLQHLFTSELPEPSIASHTLPETAPLAEAETAQLAASEAAPVAASAAAFSPLTILPAPEPEILPASTLEAPSAPAAETEIAPPAGTVIDFETALRFESESTLDQQLTQEQIPQDQIAEDRVPEDRFADDQFPLDDFSDLRVTGWQPTPISARTSEAALESASPEPRMTTIRGVVAELWEMFVYPLGRDFDFAPEWHTVFNSVKQKTPTEEAEPQPPTPALPTLVASILVTCASPPKRDFESLPAQASDLHTRFNSSVPQVSTLLKCLGILVLAFCASCGLVYFALFQNWFGIDYLLHLL